MNRRLRKKTHREEFDYLGFEVSGTFVPELPSGAVDGFCDAVIERVESLGLVCGGGFNSQSFGVFLGRYRKGVRLPNGEHRWIEVDCTEDDRQAMLAWAGEPEQVAHKIVIGPLKGSWWGKKP